MATHTYTLTTARIDIIADVYNYAETFREGESKTDFAWRIIWERSEADIDNEYINQELDKTRSADKQTAQSTLDTSKT